MAEKNIILHWSGGHHEIFQNSILSAYVPKKNILLAPCSGELNITKERNFLLGGGIINYVSCKLFLQKILML